MTEVLRVVITGSLGTGKTTFIRTISELEKVDPEHRAMDENAFTKRNGSLDFDFGKLSIRHDQALHLYGTPGHPQFDFMWDMLISKAHACIHLVDVHRPEMFRQSRQILSFINSRTSVPKIIGLTHQDCEGAWEPEDVVLALGLFDVTTRLPLVNLNANNRYSVIRALLLLLKQLQIPSQKIVSSLKKGES